MMGGMMGGMMGTMPMKDSTHAMGMRDSTMSATHASLITRADALVGRTERMMDIATPHSDAYPMPAGVGVGDPATAMPAQLHQLAIGIRTLLRQMEAMHPAGASEAMSRDRPHDTTEMHQAAEALVAGLERAVSAVDRSGRPPASGQL